MVAHEGVGFDVLGNDAHLVLELAAFGRRWLEENEFTVYGEENGCYSHIL